MNGLLIVGGTEVNVASWSGTLRTFIKDGWRAESGVLVTPGWGYPVGSIHFTLRKQGMCAELIAS